MAFLLLSPLMPNVLKALAKERTAKPLHLASTGRHFILQPACWQWLTSPAYLESFLSKASSRWSANGPISSNSTVWLVDSDDVRSKGSCCDVAGKLQLSLEVHQQLPVFHRGQDTCWSSSGRGWLSPSSDKGDWSFGGSKLLCPHKSCTDGFSNVLEDLIMPPSIPAISKGPSAAAEDVFQGFLLGAQGACRCLCYASCVQVGRAWEHIIHCLSSHLVQAPCCFIPTVLQDLDSSTAALISSWTRRCLSFPLVFNWGVGKDPSPAWPQVTTPTRLL